LRHSSSRVELEVLIPNTFKIVYVRGRFVFRALDRKKLARAGERISPNEARCE
jgi:hypothetical protein